MEPKEFDLEFPRGNTFEFSFDLLDEENKKITRLDEIYFTIKKNYKDTDYLLQKRLSRKDGLSFFDSEVTVLLKYEDTIKLDFSRYTYDVAIKVDDLFKTVLIGNVELTKNVTHKI